MSSIKGKRVLITGAAGFLGREVVAQVKAHEPAALFGPRKAEFDLTEQSDVRELFEKLRPDTVIHLAAVVGGIGANRKNPGKFFYDNAMMGIMLLEEGRRSGVSKFVTVGTICAYPKHTPVPFQEAELWNGYPEETNAPYGLAKKMLLVQSQAYRQQYGFNAIYLLPVNLYGPGDNFDPESSHVIPAIVRKVVEARDAGRPFIEAWGTGKASREFLFVRDAARGIVLAAEKYDEADPMNLGVGAEISIRDLVYLICDLCGYRGEVRWNPNQPDGQPRRCLDTQRAKAKIGFVAETDFRAGLAETIRYFEQTRGR